MLTFKGLDFLRLKATNRNVWKLDVLRLGISNSYVLRLVILNFYG